MQTGPQRQKSQGAEPGMPSVSSAIHQLAKSFFPPWGGGSKGSGWTEGGNSPFLFSLLGNGLEIILSLWKSTRWGVFPSPPTRISEYHAAFYFSKYKLAQCEQTWEDICDILLVKN